MKLNYNVDKMNEKSGYKKDQKRLLLLLLLLLP